MELLAAFLGAVVGFIGAIIAEPLRQHFFSPRLHLSFNKSGECVTSTQEHVFIRSPDNPHYSVYAGSHDAHYIRIKVVNKENHLAKKCYAYLIGIQRENEVGNYVPTEYVDSIGLPWSCRVEGTEYQPLDIPKGVSQFIDLISTKKSDPKSYTPRIQVIPQRYVGLYSDPGKFRFTIQVAGENFDPVTIRIVFCWKGNWDDFEVFHFPNDKT